MSTTPGYSGTPLARKLGIKPGFRIVLVDAPDDYAGLVSPLPDDVDFATRVTAGINMVHLFCTQRATLARALAHLRDRIRPDAMVWVSWPKRAAKVPTDVTEDTIRDVALPLGFVDVKVCAISDVWSGLKLVIRRELRPS